MCQSGPVTAATDLHGSEFTVRFGYRDEKGRDRTIDYYPGAVRVCLACGTLFPMLSEKELARLRANYTFLTPER